MLEELYNKFRYQMFVATLVLTVGMLSYFGITIHQRYVKPKKFFMTPLTITDMVTAPETHYVPDKVYFDSFGTVVTPENYEQYSTVDIEEERERYTAYVNEHALFKEEAASFKTEYTVSDANRELYELADKYYQVYWGGQRVSPIYPLAVANVETGSRADHSITWSALFPSKYVDINQLYTMNVTTVLSSESIYSALTKESSTRDRGALQMSPSYGTGSSYYNSLMSGNERDKLSGVSTSHNNWVSGASKYSGDRFYVPDVCLRLSAANTDAIDRMYKNKYIPESDMCLIAMLAMYHHRSGVWSSADHGKSVGEWKSGNAAFEYANLVSSPAMVAELRKYAMQHEDRFWMDADTVKDLFKSVTGRSMSEFASRTLVCTYPIKVEYAYIKLCLMYTSEVD